MAVQMQNRTRNTAMGVSRRSRTWVLYCLSLLQMFVGTTISIAVVSLLIYQLNVSSGFYGAYSAVFALFYVLSPILLRGVSKRLGGRRAILLGLGLTIVAILIELYCFNPVTAILVAALEGICWCLFWTNIENALSKANEDSPAKGNAETVRKYGICWGLGGLVGSIVGFTIAMVTANIFMILYASLIITGVSVGLATFIPDFSTIKGDSKVGGENSQKDKTEGTHRKKIIAKNTIIYPIGAAYLAVFLYIFINEVYGTSLPYLLYNAEVKIQWLYMLIFLQQLAQILAMTGAARILYQNKFRNMIISFGLVGLISLLLTGAAWQTAFVAAVIVSLLNGIVYDFATQVVFKYSSSDKSLHYISKYQSISAIASVFSPFIAGIFAERDIAFNFQLITVVLVLGVVLLPFFKSQNQYQQTHVSLFFHGEKVVIFTLFHGRINGALVSANPKAPISDHLKMPYYKDTDQLWT